MSAEIQFTANQAGDNLYAVITHPADGTVRDVVAGAWDTYADADIDDYDVPLTRKGTASPHYQADLPAGLSATTGYLVDVFKRVGSGPAITDPLIGRGWIGPVPSDVLAISQDAVAADNLEAILDGTGGTGLVLSAIDLGGSDLDALIGSVNTNVLNNGTSIGTVIAQTDSLEETLSTVDAEVGLIQGSLNTIAGGGFNASTDTLEAIAAAVSVVDGNVGSVLTDTGTTLPASLAALNNLSAGDIAASLSTYDAPTHAEMTAAFTEIKGATWLSATDTLEAIRDNAGGGATAEEVRIEIDSNSTQLAAIKSQTDLITADSGGGGGDGDTVVNHDTGGTDNLRVTSGGGAGGGLDNVTIRAYLTSEYDTDATAATLRASAVTGADGRWVNPMMLDSGQTYTLIYSRTDLTTTTQEVTVS